MGLADADDLCQDKARPPRRLAEFIMLQLIRWTSLAAIAALLVLMLGPFQGAEGAVGMTDGERITWTVLLTDHEGSWRAYDWGAG